MSDEDTTNPALLGVERERHWREDELRRSWADNLAERTARAERNGKSMLWAKQAVFDASYSRSGGDRYEVEFTDGDLATDIAKWLRTEYGFKVRRWKPTKGSTTLSGFGASIKVDNPLYSVEFKTSDGEQLAALRQAVVREVSGDYDIMAMVAERASIAAAREGENATAWYDGLAVLVLVAMRFEDGFDVRCQTRLTPKEAAAVARFAAKTYDGEATERQREDASEDSTKSAIRNYLDLWAQAKRDNDRLEAINFGFDAVWKQAKALEGVDASIALVNAVQAAMPVDDARHFAATLAQRLAADTA